MKKADTVVKTTKAAARAPVAATKRPPVDVDPDGNRIDVGEDGNREDRELIESCITAGESIAAYDAAFKHDPDGNSKHAEPRSVRFARQRDKALARATELQACTVQGVDAKARLAVALVEEEIANAIGPVVVFSEVATKFLHAFAVDTKRMMRALSEAPGSVIGVKSEKQAA
jgi:hypothetical protein